MHPQDTTKFLNRYKQLSAEELTIVRAICRGDRNKNIAASLYVSVRTVENRRRALMQKLQVATVFELARHIGALEQAGLIERVD